MPIAFKNASAAILTTTTNIYTAPVGTTSVVFSLYLSNIDGTNNADVSLMVWDDSASMSRLIGKDIPIPIGSTLEWGKIALEPGDILQATSTVANEVEAFVGILEKS